MQVKVIKGVTRTIGESQGYIGLPLLDEAIELADGTTMHTMHTMTSAWQPSPEEIERIVAGCAIHLTILGTNHPPVFVSVSEELE